MTPTTVTHIAHPAQRLPVTARPLVMTDRVALPAAAPYVGPQQAEDDPMRKPADCGNMAQLRAEIDRLDDELVRLFAERATYIDRAAQIKARDGLPARIEARVEEVALLARTRAADAGLSPDLAEALWRLMMEHFIAQEDAQLGGKDGGNPDRR